MSRHGWSEWPVILGVGSEPTPYHFLPISPTRWLNRQSVWWLLWKESSHLGILESHCHRWLQTDFFFVQIFKHWGRCQGIKAIIRTRIQFLRVNSPSFSQWHSRTFSSVYSPLLFFSLFFFYHCFFFVSSLRCPNEFTGDRCQNYVMASFYSTSTPFLSLPE